ncbi:VOC family protein [Vibrio neptunius]|uniref:VOC family protein n=1 Tax=Vibrio neptunius TaxID=170651 RepID=A0ABS2ZWV3_9VIBR|nr:VOC family protein [Vibrio neptunius]MBN3492165.1 VOC family protein [Vibrio neptunius]MBN3514662.1 VOC family protein [Vibrio neptunius]MBN3549212.1 VOC family protein [Vibrio neptunius]MBN3576737.1 VOC family protein [Vibrio neptunius]MCH9870401.1 VOC family protein [Vibrio neptunius]
MRIKAIDHFTIRTAHLDMTIRFFEQSIGLQRGPRPQFAFPGAWLYDNDGHPILHLVSLPEGHIPETLVDYLGGKDGQSGSGAIDHISFKGLHLSSTQQHLTRLKIPFRERVIPQINEHQIFLDDPNGITIEIIFPFSPDHEIVGNPLPVVEVT